MKSGKINVSLSINGDNHVFSLAAFIRFTVA